MNVSGIFSLGYDDCGHGYGYKKRHYKKYYGGGYKHYGGYKRYKHYGGGYKHYGGYKHDNGGGLLGIDIDL